MHIWKSEIHADGTGIPGYFVLGINEKVGCQITYHIPLDRWNDCDCKILVRAPKFDGHDSWDVLDRVKRL